MPRVSYADWLILEHGSGRVDGHERKIGSTIDHAHLHIVGFPADELNGSIRQLTEKIEETLLEEYPGLSRVRWDGAEGNQLLWARTPYLLVGRGTIANGLSELTVYFDAEGEVNSTQVLRRICYRILRQDIGRGWDWTAAD